MRPPDMEGSSHLACFPFVTSDLCNWKLQSLSFTEKPQTLIALLDIVLFAHQPTWYNCQQLLQVVFRTMEREKESNKNASSWFQGKMVTPQMMRQLLILLSPFPDWGGGWDHNMAGGREWLKVCHQILIGGF